MVDRNHFVYNTFFVVFAITCVQLLCFERIEICVDEVDDGDDVQASRQKAHKKWCNVVLAIGIINKNQAHDKTTDS